MISTAPASFCYHEGAKIRGYMLNNLLKPSQFVPCCTTLYQALYRANQACFEGQNSRLHAQPPFRKQRLPPTPWDSPSGNFWGWVSTIFFFYFPREGHRISKQFLMQIVNLGSRCTRYPGIEFRVYEHGWEKHYNLFSLYSTKIKHLLIINVGNKTQQYLVPEILWPIEVKKISILQLADIAKYLYLSLL